jgi:hypothetical protein
MRAAESENAAVVVVEKKSCTRLVKHAVVPSVARFRALSPINKSLCRMILEPSTERRSGVFLSQYVFKCQTTLVGEEAA